MAMAKKNESEEGRRKEKKNPPNHAKQQSSKEGEAEHVLLPSFSPGVIMCFASVSPASSRPHNKASPPRLPGLPQRPSAPGLAAGHVPGENPGAKHKKPREGGRNTARPLVTGHATGGTGHGQSRLGSASRVGAWRVENQRLFIRMYTTSFHRVFISKPSIKVAPWASV